MISRLNELGVTFRYIACYDDVSCQFEGFRAFVDVRGNHDSDVQFEKGNGEVYIAHGCLNPNVSFLLRELSMLNHLIDSKGSIEAIVFHHEADQNPRRTTDEMSGRFQLNRFPTLDELDRDNFDDEEDLNMTA